LSVLPLEEKEWQNSLNKALPLMHCKKVSYFFENWGNLLGKVTYLKIKGNFYLSQKPVRYCMLPAQNQNVFTPFARTPLRVTSEHLG